MRYDLIWSDLIRNDIQWYHTLVENLFEMAYTHVFENCHIYFSCCCVHIHTFEFGIIMLCHEGGTSASKEIQKKRIHTHNMQSTFKATNICITAHTLFLIAVHWYFDFSKQASKQANTERNSNTKKRMICWNRFRSKFLINTNYHYYWCAIHDDNTYSYM